jgi:L-ribulose-5-phosphate 3-epimerase UlaE
MATSVYFNNYSVGVINEQRLLEDLIVESIQIMGHDVYYIPRDSYNGDDEIYGEAVNTKFTRAYYM